jgi:uncharacterized repeat protein (TIGR03803 family)
MFFSLAVLLLLASASPAQTVSVVYTFDGSNASQDPEGAPVQGRDGKLYGTTIGLTYGSIFRLTTSGHLDQLFALNGTDGSYPNSGVTLASDGNFYGTAAFDGSENEGVLFKITPSGSYTVLHNFGTGIDGGTPEAPPIQASDGSLYGTTHGGPGTSVVYRYTLAGIYSVIAAFTGSAGTSLVGPLVQGSDGNLYGTASQGGAHNSGTVFKMTTTGSILGFYSFNYNGNAAKGGYFPTGRLIQASDGNFYGVTNAGGTFGFGTVFRMTPTVRITTLYSFQGAPNDGAYPNSGLVQATDGNLYGATGGGGTQGFGSLFQISIDGAYKSLSSLTQLTGDVPATALLQDTTGTFYGTALEAGSAGYGTVFGLDMGLGPFVALVLPVGKVGGVAQILGQNLTGTTSVTFNGVAATSFKVVTDTYMTAVVPSGATTGRVVVTTTGGALTSNVNFRIIR